MSNTTIIKSLFIYDDTFIEPNIKSLNSILSQKYPGEIYLIGYVYNDIIKKLISDMYSKYAKIIFFNQNYGKLYLLRNIKKFINEKYDNYYYFDHDIILIDKTFYTINYDTILSDNPIVFFNQTYDNRHNLTNMFSHKILSKKYDENIYCYFINEVYNKWIASGGFICNNYIIDIFNEINDTGNIYGDEDFIIGNELSKNNIISVIINIDVIHPFFIHEQYNKSKINKIKKAYSMFTS
jgi:hypothetical protein